MLEKTKHLRELALTLMQTSFPREQFGVERPEGGGRSVWGRKGKLLEIKGKENGMGKGERLVHTQTLSFVAPSRKKFLKRFGFYPSQRVFLRELALAAPVGSVS